MDYFASRAAFTDNDKLSPDAVRYLNALQNEIAALRALIVALTARVTALEP